MSANMNTHRGASAGAEELQTLDNRQSGVNVGASRPSTGRRLSADVPAFVPTPTRSRFAGAGAPAMPTIRELTAYEAGAETRAWYAHEGHAEKPHAATAGTRLPGTQYDNGLRQVIGGPYMHLDYHGPSQPRYPASPAHTGYPAASPDVEVRLGYGNYPPSTPAQQMRTGPRGITFSAPVQEAYSAVSYQNPTPRTPANRSGGNGYPVGAHQIYRIDHEHTLSPFPAQRATGVYPSAIAPGALPPLIYAQWESAGRQRPPPQYAASGAADHYSSLPPRPVPSESPVRQTYPFHHHSVRAQYGAPGLAAFYPSLAPQGLSPTSFKQWVSSTGQQRSPVQQAGAGLAIYPSTLAPGYISTSAFVQQAYRTDRQRAPAQPATADWRVCHLNFTPGTMRSSDLAPHASTTDKQRIHQADLHDPSITATHSHAGYANTPPAARPTYAGHEQFTRFEVDAFIRRAQDEEWMRQAKQDEMLARQHAFNQERRASGMTWPEQRATMPKQSQYNETLAHQHATNQARRLTAMAMSGWKASMPEQGQHSEILIQQHEISRERQVGEMTRREQTEAVTEESQMIITEAAQRALEQRLADRIRRERVEERERAARGIPDPQEAADRLQFQRLAETFNYQNYSRTPVNPQLPNAHVVASDRSGQELVSEFEIALGNMALYHRGYAPFPGEFDSQTTQSSPGQASTRERPSRPDTIRITDSIPNWYGPAIRNNPEIRRDFLNNSTFIPFMEPTGQDDNRPATQESPELLIWEANTISSSGYTSITPLDTPSESEQTPTESAPEEEMTPRPTAAAILVSEAEKTPRPSAAVIAAPEQDRTRRRLFPVVLALREESTPERLALVASAPEEETAAWLTTSAFVIPAPEQQKIPQLFSVPVSANEKEMTAHPAGPAVPASEGESILQSSATAAPISEHEKTPQRSACVVPASEQEPTSQPTGLAFLASERETTVPFPSLAAPVSVEGNTLLPLASENHVNPGVVDTIGAANPAIPTDVTASIAPTVQINAPVPAVVTWASIVATQWSSPPEPSRAAQSPGNAEDQLRAAEVMTPTHSSIRAQGASARRFSDRGRGNAPGGRVFGPQSHSTTFVGRGAYGARTPTRTSHVAQAVEARHDSRGSANLNMTQDLIVQSVEDTLGQGCATESVLPSQIRNQFQALAEDDLSHGPVESTTGDGERQRRRRNKKKKRKNKKRKNNGVKEVEASSQQGPNSPNDDGSNLATDAQ